MWKREKMIWHTRLPGIKWSPRKISGEVGLTHNASSLGFLAESDFYVDPWISLQAAHCGFCVCCAHTSNLKPVSIMHRCLAKKIIVRTRYHKYPCNVQDPLGSRHWLLPCMQPKSMRNVKGTLHHRQILFRIHAECQPRQRLKLWIPSINPASNTIVNPITSRYHVSHLKMALIPLLLWLGNGKKLSCFKSTSRSRRVSNSSTLYRRKTVAMVR